MKFQGNVVLSGVSISSSEKVFEKPSIIVVVVTYSFVINSNS